MYLVIWKCKKEGRYFKAHHLKRTDVYIYVFCPYCRSREITPLRRKLNVDV